MTKFRSNDPLNQLLRQALHQQKTQVQVKVAPAPLPDPVFDLYRNPLNWTTARTISLVHRSPDGREVFLGVFTELKNERAKARRLIPAHVSPGSTIPREVVAGDYWLHPQIPPVAVDSPREVAAIRERFRELMEGL